MPGQPAGWGGRHARDPLRFKPYVDLYHRALREMDKPLMPVGVHSPGHVADTDAQARDDLWPHYREYVGRIGRERGWPPPTRIEFERSTGPGGSLYVGSPDTVARKIAELRVLDGEVSASEAGAPILLISQFTLYGDTRKGRRPSWAHAAPGPEAEPLVEAVVADLRGRGLHVETGRFGAMMEVSLVNDGPFTVLVEV